MGARHTGPPPPRALSCLPDRHLPPRGPAAAGTEPLPLLERTQHRARLPPPTAWRCTTPGAPSFPLSPLFRREKPSSAPPLRPPFLPLCSILLTPKRARGRPTSPWTICLDSGGQRHTHLAGFHRGRAAMTPSGEGQSRATILPFKLRLTSTPCPWCSRDLHRPTSSTRNSSLP
jgi:hypothetical protein